MNKISSYYDSNDLVSKLQEKRTEIEERLNSIVDNVIAQYNEQGRRAFLLQDMMMTLIEGLPKVDKILDKLEKEIDDIPFFVPQKKHRY